MTRETEILLQAACICVIGYVLAPVAVLVLAVVAVVVANPVMWAVCGVLFLGAVYDAVIKYRKAMRGAR